ncbi:MAG: type II secretion system protein GspJ [Gammaproteobacteria bacterium]|nr:type II secretion system protein GspJ [Gammaproteobacteria bacterium]
MGRSRGARPRPARSPSRRGGSRLHGRVGGFTLVEILTALAIFGVIGVLATRIVAGMIELGGATREHAEGLADLQRAMGIIERDIEQFTDRPIRDELGDPLPGVIVTGVSLLELTRMGWQNPLRAPRSELQRVAYVLRDDKLVRLYWAVLDRAPDTRPVAQLLLDGVADARFAVFDEFGEKHGHWPLPPDSEDTDELRLAAVEMHLQLESHGLMHRLWMLPEGTEHVYQAERPESGEEGRGSRQDSAGRDGRTARRGGGR